MSDQPTDDGTNDAVNLATELRNNEEKYIPQLRHPDDVPYVGQPFNSSEEALLFYNNYARLSGFNTRKQSNKLSEDKKTYRWKEFTCNRQGLTNLKYQEKDKHKQPRAGERKRARTRCGCTASMTVTKQNDGSLWAVSIFVVEHNHPLTSPGKVHLLKSHRKVTSAQKSLVSQFSQLNIPTCQQYRVMGVESGGPSSVGCLEQDIRNVERDMRQKFLGHDAETLVKMFEKEKKEDENFYYSFTTEDGVFQRCFWADSSSRGSYVYFGDIVVFDTTYNTNRYDMIFAPLVGVNNHMQTILFGCGFFSDEKTESFIWLFSQFLEAMPGGPIPKVIITDQDQAIGGAIEKVFPLSVHRLCLWHITNKFTEKLGPILYGDYSDVLYSVVYRSETPEEFERKWGELMSTTPLGGNDWLRTMYGIRHRWVPAYVKDFFAAGMSSSQRVEAHHSFLKSYVLRKNSLADFLVRFQLALVHQREQELRADHIDKSEVPVISSLFHLEAQMIGIYTKAVFLLFQDELKESVSYDCSKVSSTAEAKVYQLTRFNGNSDRPRHVTWFTASDLMTCSCKLFEFKGYLCRHILRLMCKKDIRTLSNHYILVRWTKNTKSVPVFDRTPQALARQSSISTRVMMNREFMKLSNDVFMSPEVSSFVTKGIRELGKQAREMLAAGGQVATNIETSMNDEDDLTIHDPVSARAKGSGKRLRSSKEKGMSQHNRKCGFCGEPGHTVKKCPQLQSRTGLVDEVYEPDMSFATGNNDDVAAHDMFGFQAADNYSAYQTTIQKDDFLRHL